MTGWTPSVDTPFRDDPQFWAAVGLSADALWSLVIATALVLAFSWPAAVAFALPVALLVMGGRHARASTSRTQRLFPSRSQWRDAERRAVAAAIPGALIRHVPQRWRRGHA